MKYIGKITHPLFIAAILALALNDWCFKPMFHNAVTGKLSDFAGLFAFPFFLSCIWPQRVKTIHILVILLFALWKTTWIQPCLDFLNTVGFPVHRTPDLSDYTAFGSVPFSYYIFHKPVYAVMHTWSARLLGAFSIFIFAATTMLPPKLNSYCAINKEYKFDISKRQLVSCINNVQIHDVYKLNKAYGHINFNNRTNTFYLEGRTDTLALLLDYTKIGDQDTIRLKSSYADIIIWGNDHSSGLKLLNAYRFSNRYSDKDYREKTIRAFEKHFIRKIK
ncbi:MAG: hypothetical protein JST26_05020 [Bacteroidetes bacterium]|nr:hypothetical protein [Bacteroidota bacterium]